MCTAAEAKTLQRVYGRYNSFFRKVIPAKRVQKPVLWYTRLTVYGNPGRVVNGYARGFLPYFAGRRGTACGAMLVLVPRPRPKEAAGAHPPALLQGNPPSRVLRFSLLRCGEHPRGYPDVASGRCASTLRPWGRERLLEVHVRKTRSPVIPARKGGIVRT